MQLKTLAPMAIVLGVAAGCAIAPQAELSESGNDRAVVRVGYGLFGPSVDIAEASAGLVARDHCESLGKTNQLVWSKRESRDGPSGEFILFYACERVDERFSDRRAPGPTTTEDIRELARPMIETSHAEARRHRTSQ